MILVLFSNTILKVFDPDTYRHSSQPQSLIFSFIILIQLIFPIPGFSLEPPIPIKELLETAKDQTFELQDTGLRNNVLKLIAETQIQAGLFQDALQIGKSLKGPHASDKILGRIVKEHLRRGNFQEARLAAESMTESFHQGRAWGSLLAHQVDSGNFQDAWDLVSSLEKGVHSDKALEVMVTRLSGTGNMEKAHETVKK